MSIFKLTPTFKDYLWGGTRLKESFGKVTDMAPCAESWELSMHRDGPSYVGDTKLSDIVTEDMLGKNVTKIGEFPMLIKLIDAKQSLSVQVHPSDDYAKRNENSLGKTEMWYIVDADEGAGIYLGFKRKISRDELIDAINGNSLTELLHFYPVKSGECYFIPSGTVHAIGAGCLICEIQQSSNLTYRVYDYGRVGADGKPRELHVDRAIAVADLKKYELKALPDSILGISKYFTVRKIAVTGDIRVEMDNASFKSFTVVRGSGMLNGEPVSLGESYFIGADEDSFALSGDMDVILTELRRYRVEFTPCDSGYTATLIDDIGRIIATAIGCDGKSARASLLDSLYLTENDIT